MAHVTKAYLEIELTGLRKQYEKAISDAKAIDGAIQFCEHLLKTLSGDTVTPVDESSPEPSV